MQTSPIYMPENHMDKLYNSKNFMVRYVHLNRLKNITKMMPKEDGLKVLDGGCGEGHLLYMLNQKNSNNQYYGIDLTKEALDKAKQRVPKAELRLADLSKIDFPDNYFDFITCTETIEHVDAYQEVLAEFKRILKPGGFLVITFPNEVLWTLSRLVLGRKPIRVVDHINFFTPKKIMKYAKMNKIKGKGLPFSWPFFISLGYLIKFEK